MRQKYFRFKEQMREIVMLIEYKYIKPVISQRQRELEERKKGKLNI